MGRLLVSALDLPKIVNQIYFLTGGSLQGPGVGPGEMLEGGLAQHCHPCPAQKL